MRDEAEAGADAAESRRRLPARSTCRRSRPSPSSSTPRIAGASIRRDFLAATCLDKSEIRRSEDLLVDRLFAPVVRLGAPLMSAVYPRAYLDVNREPYELDPKMFAGRLPTYANVRSLRVAGGLGTIPRVVSDAANIYKGPLPVEEGLARIERIYRPYHDTLRRLLAQTHVAFGLAILIDCHSMPSNIRGGPSARPARFRARRPLRRELHAGADRLRRRRRCSGSATRSAATSPMPAASSPSITDGRRAACMRCRSRSTAALYMDEYRLEPHRGFERLSADLGALAQSLLARRASEARAKRRNSREKGRVAAAQV